ncbi:peptidylprolyl isomerase [Candidatus Woesearchaeota archaeon]|nr:peptidylprolyl isomerase [Candidatus Woesearchaeota archaeon]
MNIKKGDFVELEFTARLKDENIVFDTTSADVAKKAGIFSANMKYAPVVVCVGQQMVLSGLDESLEGRDVEKFVVELVPEKAFGKKDPHLLQLIPKQKFTDQRVQPVVGLQVNIDDVVGTVRSVTGGRVIVDFNHPFAGKTVSYDVDIKRLVTDSGERLSALVRVFLKQEDPKVTIDGKKATVVLPVEIPDQIQQELTKRWAPLVGIDTVVFVNVL